MVNQRKFVSIEEAEKIFMESQNMEEAIDRLHNLKKRQKAPSPPKGGISVRAAARKYYISRSTLSRWAKTDKIKIIARLPNWLYIDEGSLIETLRNNGVSIDNLEIS